MGPSPPPLGRSGGAQHRTARHLENPMNRARLSTPRSTALRCSNCFNFARLTWRAKCPPRY